MKKSIIICIIIILGCNKPKESAKKDIKSVARELMMSAKNCALITIDTLGNANARAMDPFQPEDNFTVWMATNPKSRKVVDIKNNPKVTLYYFDKETAGYVTIQGEAQLVNSQEEKDRFWKDEWKNFYKNRTTDYLLIKVVPKKLNVISEKHNILGDSITWGSPELLFN